jgi:hypothetical protein
MDVVVLVEVVVKIKFVSVEIAFVFQIVKEKLVVMMVAEDCVEIVEVMKYV